MGVKIESKDMNAIEKIAKKYNVTMVEFGRAVIAQSKVRDERQYRVSAEEFDLITEKAKRRGMTRMGYSEAACEEFLNILQEGITDAAVVKFEIGSTRYGQGRTKRITVRFNDEKVEDELVKIAAEYMIDMGSLIRYCALNH